MTAPISVASLVSRATSDPARVAQELGTWVLVGPAPSEEGSEWSFRTLSARTVRDASGGIEAVLDETYLVHLLKKAKAGPFASTILVGRSRTNDVCVAHSSVSKLHARMRIEGGALFLSDAGSSNGTFVGVDRLAGAEERRLTHGAQVRFGGCGFQAFEPERFVALLARFSSSR